MGSFAGALERANKADFLKPQWVLVAVRLLALGVFVRPLSSRAPRVPPLSPRDTSRCQVLGLARG